MAEMNARAHRHMYFDDRAAVRWLRSLAETLDEAGRQKKCILVQLGRPDCGGSRALVERVIPKEEIAEALQSGFLCVCADPAEPALESGIADRLASLPKQAPTPVCMYLDSSGRVVHSTVGGRPPAVFLRDLTEAEAKARAARSSS